MSVARERVKPKPPPRLPFAAALSSLARCGGALIVIAGLWQWYFGRWLDRCFHGSLLFVRRMAL